MVMRIQRRIEGQKRKGRWLLLKPEEEKRQKKKKELASRQGMEGNPTGDVFGSREKISDDLDKKSKMTVAQEGKGKSRVTHPRQIKRGAGKGLRLAGGRTERARFTLLLPDGREGTTAGVIPSDWPFRLRKWGKWGGG